MSKRGHIVHARVPWDGEERFFRPTKSVFSIFGVPKSGFFVRQLPKRQTESWAEHPT
jgi:hypothetical protein